MFKLLIVILMTTQWTIAKAAQVEIVNGRYEGEQFVSITGPIVKGDFKQVETAAKIAIRNGSGPLTFLLNSEGGNITEAMLIGKFARDMLASTQVWGNTIYIPGSANTKELEGYAKRFHHIKFGLHPVKTAKLAPSDIVRCYSACVIVFYGGVDRTVHDNIDYRHNNANPLPAIGIHRPYYEKSKYSSMSPTEAKESYRTLETTVRRYLIDMGAPTAIIDRMLRKASNDIDFMNAEEFSEFYQEREPFIDEWLIAKCGNGGFTEALSKKENREYESYHSALLQAVKNNEIKSKEDADNFTLPGFPASYFKLLEEITIKKNTDVMQCKRNAVQKHQSEWAHSF